MSENRSPSRARPTYDIWPALPALPRHGLGRRRIAFHRAIPAIPAAARRRPRLSARPPWRPPFGGWPSIGAGNFAGATEGGGWAFSRWGAATFWYGIPGPHLIRAQEIVLSLQRHIVPGLIEHDPDVGL